jgi:hypothetical protein
VVEEVQTALEAAMFRVRPAATAAPSDQVPEEATVGPRLDPQVAADLQASAAAAVVVVAAGAVGVVKEKP